MARPVRRMPDSDALAARVRAVERALSDADSLPVIDDAQDLNDLAGRVERVEERLDELDGDVQALRGYVGHVEETTTPRRRPRKPRSRVALPHPVPDFDPAEEAEPAEPSLRERLSGLL